MENTLAVNGTKEINGKEVKEVRGGFGENQKCLLDKQIADVHSIKAIHVRELINKNIKRFKEGVDYIDLKQGIDHTDTLLELGYSKSAITQTKNIYVLSERGYAKVIKIMDSDIAWEIHDELIDNYFKMEEQLEQINEKDKLLLGLFSNDSLVVAESHKALVALETKPLLEKIEEDTPKVDYYERVLQPEKVIKMLTTTEIAKDLGISAINLNKQLHELGVQYKQGGTWFLYNKYQDRVPEFADYSVTDYGQTLKWTEKGREWILDLIK